LSNHPINLLDCTLRDGGYYNDWDFDRDLVVSYLEVMEQVKIDMIEIGFRFSRKDGFLGPLAYSPDEWLSELPLPRGATIGIMCNAKDLIDTGDAASVVRSLFTPCNESPIDLVRIAAHFNEVEECADAVATLHELGYRVGLNFMQAGGRSAEDICAKASVVQDWPLDVLYFADSLGNMTPEEVTRTVQAIRRGWDGPVGFHSHDNMGNALANTVSAFRAGATWLDGTVLGMGRGAGNVRLEYLLLEMARLGIRDHGPLDPLLELVVGEFGALHRKYQWGANLFYYLSAMYSVHPTYVQEMLSDERYSHSEVINALQRLNSLGGAQGYSRSRLREALGDEFNDAPGSWCCADWLAGRDVLLVAAGDMGQRHRHGIKQFIRRFRPFVICLNSNPWMPHEDVDVWASCNPQRLLLDTEYYRNRAGTLVVPTALIPDDTREALRGWETLDYGLQLAPDAIEFGHYAATLPKPLTALYALVLVTAAKARRIYLAGFDGYSERDPRHLEMEHGLQLYAEQRGALPLVALTPTTLQSVIHSSVYAPEE